MRVNDNQEEKIMTTLTISERQAFKALLVEMTKSLKTIDTEREVLKDTAAAAQEKFDVPKKMVSKLARVMFKHNYADIVEENEHFTMLYETLVEGKKEAA